jgi:hypothetical protein
MLCHGVVRKFFNFYIAKKMETGRISVNAGVWFAGFAATNDWANRENPGYNLKMHVDGQPANSNDQSQLSDSSLGAHSLGATVDQNTRLMRRRRLPSCLDYRLGGWGETIRVGGASPFPWVTFGAHLGVLPSVILDSRCPRLPPRTNPKDKSVSQRHRTIL